MKIYWGVESYLHAFLTSALDGDEWPAPCPGRFTLREKTATHLIRSWLSLRAVQDAVVNRKIPYLSLTGIESWLSSQ